MIDNGDFEAYRPQEGAGRWHTEPAPLFIWDDFSHDAGKKSMLIDASLVSLNEPGFATISYKHDGLKVGRTYLLEIWLTRDHNIDGIYPTVSLLGKDVRLSDFWAFGKWQKISLFFKAPIGEKSLPSLPIIIKIPRGDYRLWIDDLSLREFTVVLLWPGNQNNISTDQKDPPSFNFYWQMPETDRLLDVTLVIKNKLNDNPQVQRNGRNSLPIQSEHRYFITNLAQRRSISIPRDELPQGKYEWRIEVRQYKALIAVSEWRELEIRGSGTNGSMPQNIHPDVVSIAEKSEAHNKQFFPIGIYNADTADFAELSSIGFNAIHVSPRDLNQMGSNLKSAQENNLKILISPSVILKGNAFAESATDQRTTPVSPACLDQVLAWYLDDEPEGQSVSPKDIFLKREELRRLGYAQPGAVALLRSWRAPDYASALDIFMSDPYPVPFEPLPWIGDCLDEISGIIAGDESKTVWSVIQAFGWDYMTKKIATTGQGRVPTAPELKAMSWLALIHGARGLFYYTYLSGGYFIKDHSGLWEGMKSTVREIREKLPLIRAKTLSAGRMMSRDLDSDGNPGVHFAIKEIPEGAGMRSALHLIAVNTIEKPVTASLVWKNRTISFSFAPLEMKIQRLE